MTQATLATTELIQPGSLLQHDLRLRLPAGAAADPMAEALRTEFAREGWRIRTAGSAEPGMNRFLDRAASFLTLAGLTALLVGGIGVATGVRSWLDARARSIATLRCLGAPSSVIFLSYLIQVLGLALARHRHRAGGRLRADLGGGAGPGRGAAGAAAPGALSAAAGAGRALWAADRAGLRALAARPGGADLRRGAVPRRGAAGGRLPRLDRCWR